MPVMVEPSGTVELSVRLVVGAEPVRGTARLPNGQDSEFWGWLELAELVHGAALGGAATTHAGGSVG
jgi:hypothetical protein